MEKAATDIYSFRELRENGFTYVDKTALMVPLINRSIGKQFFLARPRRFGKSLLVSTLHCLFEGRRELFQGLAIEDRWDWSKTWPVIHLDMGTAQSGTIAELREFLFRLMETESERLGVPLREAELPSIVFRNLIEDVARTSPDGQCVVLIDEYDKPLLPHLSRPDITQFRDELKPFYGVIKYTEAKQRFTFLTGVSKFSKV
ncbi:MAG: AAA family ATPase, partial [Kiritimatiellia bacterium]